MAVYGFDAYYGSAGNDNVTVTNTTDSTSSLTYYTNGGADSFVGGHENDNVVINGWTALETDSADFAIDGNGGTNSITFSDTAATSVTSVEIATDGKTSIMGNDSAVATDDTQIGQLTGFSTYNLFDDATYTLNFGALAPSTNNIVSHTGNGASMINLTSITSNTISNLIIILY